MPVSVPFVGSPLGVVVGDTDGEGVGGGVVGVGVVCEPPDELPPVS